MIVHLPLLIAMVLFVQCGRDARPWSVVLVTVDTLRPDRLGCYGGTGARTPCADRLAREGCLFTSSFCSIPITLPSHTSILTGLYPRYHEVLSHGFTLDPAFTTLPEILTDHGYQTAAFISSHVLDNKYGISQGFDLYWQRYRFVPPKMAKEILLAEAKDVLTEAVIQWSEIDLDEPFFLWLHWFHPHKPYEPPPPWRTLHDPNPESELKADVKTLEQVWKGELEIDAEERDRIRMLYDGEVAFSDQQLAAVLEHLEEMGRLDRTIVVFTADHGEVLYEHERYFGHDIMLYDPSLQVPLLIWAPGLVPGGALSETTVRNIDIMPTLLDLLGIPLGDVEIEGRSFAAALQGETLPDVPVFAELFPPREDWKSEPRHAVRYGPWKLITIDGRETEPELYHLDTDPGETENIALADSAKAAELLALLRLWMEKNPQVTDRFPDLSADEIENLRSLGYITD